MTTIFPCVIISTHILYFLLQERRMPLTIMPAVTTPLARRLLTWCWTESGSWQTHAPVSRYSHTLLLCQFYCIGSLTSANSVENINIAKYLQKNRKRKGLHHLGQLDILIIPLYVYIYCINNLPDIYVDVALISYATATISFLFITAFLLKY